MTPSFYGKTHKEKGKKQMNNKRILEYYGGYLDALIDIYCKTDDPDTIELLDKLKEKVLYNLIYEVIRDHERKRGTEKSNSKHAEGNESGQGDR